MIDLHTHSIYSNGKLTPEQLTQKASKIGLEAITLTDCYTIQGIPELRIASQIYPQVKTLEGIETACLHKDSVRHLLGYSKKIKKGKLDIYCKRLQEDKARWLKKVLVKLAELGFNINSIKKDKFLRFRGVGMTLLTEQILQDENNRKKAEKETGIVFISPYQFIYQYLKGNKPASFPYIQVSSRFAIETLKSMNTLVVLAHPGGEYEAMSEEEIKDFISFGIDGIEVFAPYHSLEQTKKFLEITERYGLLVTGGSDFVGEDKRKTRLGVGRGNLNIPYYYFEKLVSLF